MKNSAKFYDAGMLHYGKYLPLPLITLIANVIFAGGFFTSLYLSRGIPESTIGIISSLSTASAVAGNVLFGRLCDKLGRRKPVYLFCITLCMASVTGVYYSKSLLSLIPCAMMVQFSFSCLPAVVDTWLLSVLGSRKRFFSIFRLFASLGHAIAALVYGQLVNTYGWKVIPIAAVIILVFVWLVVLPIKEGTQEKEAVPENKEKKSKQKISFKALFSNKTYLILVVTLCGLTFTTNSYYTFLPLLVERAGGTDANLGVVNMLMAFAEVPMLLLFTYFSKKVPARKLMAFSLSIYALRYVLLLFVHSIPMLYLVVPLQGFGYGLYLPAIRMIVNSLAPENMQTSAHTVCEAITNSLVGCISGMGAGFLISGLGYQAWVIVSICLASSVLAIYLLVVQPRIKRSDEQLREKA